MREWLRRSRAYLIALPLALVVGFGFHGFTAWTGNSGVPHRAVDVAKGDTGQLGPATIKLAELSVKKPAPPDPSGIGGADVPKGAVVVVATFRGRIADEAKAKKDKFIYCSSTIENGDGWKWDSEDFIGQPYIPKNVSTSCDGKTLNSKYKDVRPPEGRWYTFKTGYYVPKNRAHDLRPTLNFSKDLPHYLRFES